MIKRILRLTLLLVFLSSCNKTFEYVEVVEEETILSGTVKKEKDSKTISATSDSAAYVQAYKTFCISVKVRNDMKSSLGTTYTTPIKFKLIDSNGDDIANSIVFNDKEKIEKEISDRIFSMENNMQKAVDNNKKSEIERFRANTKVDSATVKQLINQFIQRKDEFANNNLIWYRHRNSPQYVNQNGLFCYFQTENGIPGNLRLRYQYFEDDWIFFDRVQFSIDEKAYEYIPSNTKTDSGDGKVWEWFDESIYQKDKDLIIALSNANNAKMRITGRTRFDTRTISKGEIEAMRQTLELFQALGGKF